MPIKDKKTEVVQVSDDLSFLDDIIGSMQESLENAGNQSALGIAFLGNHEFTFRFAMDKKKKFYNEVRMYKAEIPIKGEDGKETKRKIRYRVDLLDKDKDPIAPLAAELDNFQYNSQYHCAFMGEIVEVIAPKEDKYFKKGNCLLIASNRRVIDALLAAFQNVRKKPQILADAINPEKDGYCFIVKNKKGAQGSCAVQFDNFGDLHSFDPEIIKEFEEIEKIYFPEFGEENDKNGELLKNYYMELLKSKNSYVEPDKKEIDSAPASKQVDPAKEVIGNDLDAAINAAIN